MKIRMEETNSGHLSYSKGDLMGWTPTQADNSAARTKRCNADSRVFVGNIYMACDDEKLTLKYVQAAFNVGHIGIREKQDFYLL